MNTTNSKRLVEWIIKIGKDRALFWSLAAKVNQENPFINMLYKGLLSGGLGDAHAAYLMADIKRRAEKAKKPIFDYLLDLKNKGTLPHFLQSDLKLGPNSVSAVDGLIELEIKYNLRAYPKDVNMEELYRALLKTKGIGNYLQHYIVYDLVRLFGFEPPKTLEPSEKILELIKILGLHKSDFQPENWPYVDSAIHDL